MKKILLLLLLLVSRTGFSQNYDKNWDRVIEFELEGKTKSASDEVNKIYSLAKKDKNEPQIIKTFFYKSKYIFSLEEDAQTKIIANLQAEINSVSLPSKAILQLVYAQCLSGYASKNRYQIQKRTELEDTSELDFKLWSFEKLTQEVEKNYDESLKNEKVLKAIPLKNYKEILEFEKIENVQSKSLYDYIVQENIEHYQHFLNPSYFNLSSEPIAERAYELDGFKNVSFDILENKTLVKLLKIYQKLEKENPEDLRYKLDRVAYLDGFIFRDKKRHIAFLNALQKRTTDLEFTQEILLHKATLISQQAEKIKFPENNKIAISILDSILLNKNRSNFYKNAMILKNKILSKSVNVRLSDYSYNNQNTRAFITYKNTNTLNTKIFKVSQNFRNFIEKQNNKDSLIASKIKDLKAFKSVENILPNNQDYFEHTTEILLPNLETGTYLVLFESGNKTLTSENLNYTFITSSDFLVSSTEDEKFNFYQVLDRKTGFPVENVSVEIDSKNAKTNKTGTVQFKREVPKKEYYKYTSINLSKDNDSLNISFSKYISNNKVEKTEEKFEATANIYTDRAIYRPGQTVYAKAILIQEKNNIKSVVPNTTVHIEIENPNGETVKEFDLKTNEFGSIIFEYQIPVSGIIGGFTIIIDEGENIEKDPSYKKSKDEHPFWDNVDFEYSEYTFNVEEYKRPTFEITFNPIKENFPVNEIIKATGSATAFSGSKISDAKVAFKVLRTVRSQYGERNYWDPDKEKPIAFGEVKTDAQGNFSIDFKAVPEDGISKESLPVFEYTIEAVVTDISGETRTQTTIANAGYHTLKLTAEISNVIDLKDKNTIQLNSQNLNNQFIGTNGEIKIYFQSEINQKFKKREFERPEIKLISDAEFDELFPYEDNSDLIDPKHKGTLVYTKKVNTETDKEIAIDFMSDWKQGNYRIEFEAKDSKGYLIIETKDFKVFNSTKDGYSNQLFEYDQLNSDPKKDGFVDIKIKSIVPELFIKVEAFYDSNSFFVKNSILKDGKSMLRIPIKKDINNFVTINFSAVFDNKSFSEKMIIPIETLKDKIGIDVVSLRNKIEPGAIETWSFKLDKINKKIEAEVLASMYDSSLDQFQIKDWPLKTNVRYNNYTTQTEYFGFNQQYIALENLNPPLPYFNFSNQKINLNYFGFDFNNFGHYKNKYEKEIKKSKVPADAKLVYGIVTEGGYPLPGVSIIVNGTDRNVISDFDGYYEILALKGEALLFMYIGYENKIVNVATKELNVNLESSKAGLNEVVIESYHYTKRSHTAYASTITSEAFEARPNEYSLESLQGQVFGLNMSIEKDTLANGRIMLRGLSSSIGKTALIIIDGIPVLENEMKSLDPNDIENITVLKDASATAIYGNRGANGVIIIITKASLEELSKVQTRKNFNETAFFYPQIHTDKEGKFSINFTSPEALTKWKLRLLAHNKNAAMGYFESSIITQKDFMVAPNLPRFLREKDTLSITTKISNLTAEVKNGTAMLQLFDAVSMQDLNAKMGNSQNTKTFQVDAKGNTTVTWKIFIPEGLQGVQYKIVAKAGNFSDGEENILPVLTNNMLVTESIPVWVRENSTKEYTFENLKNNTSTTLRNQQLTFEYTSNPTWLAIQSLPYLMEYEHECAEQTFARYYANALASEILNSNPKIAEVFESWKKSDKPVSKLQQNEELKSVLLAETPWISDSQSEEEKKKNLATLFDLQKMKDSQKAILEKLTKKQKPSGGFAWFDDGEESEYITRHIISGLGHLQKLSKNATGDFDQITKSGVAFLDLKFLENHKKTEVNNKSQKLIWIYPYNNLHYLYARSFYLEKYPLPTTTLAITKKYTDNIKENWLQYSLYEKGLASLVLSRFGEKESAKIILESLRQTSSNNENWGMYWIENKSGWYWYQAQIETQALLIEAFAEVENDKKSVDAMKVWLLKTKQNKNWPTTKATTEAVYALLMQGTDWISVKDKTVIKIGDEKIVTKKLSENEKEAGTGYIKMNWKSDEITKEMATVSITNKSNVPGFGGFYWQYFEDLDKIKSSQESPMTIDKELYLKATTSEGKQLQKITDAKPLKIGDLVTVRLVISTKEDMEFVHLKDMRASCFEPIDVLSKYKWQDSLGYYQSTKDVATHFFFDKIKKGKFVLEYDIRVNNLGDFSNGITTIQSMYAPEFSSHTKGIRVKIAE